MANGGAFLITYPSVVTPASSLTTCTVTYGGVVTTMTLCSVNTAASTITVAGGFTTAVTKGSSISIAIGPITNPETQSGATSFKIMSYTENALTYEVDQVTSGLVPLFDCNYPCYTCESTNSSGCTSCQTYMPITTVPDQYLYPSGYECLSACPNGTFLNSSEICENCAVQCLTCSSLTVCITCDTTGNYPFYSTYTGTGWCYSMCPVGCSANFTCTTSCTAP